MKKILLLSLFLLLGLCDFNPAKAQYGYSTDHFYTQKYSISDVCGNRWYSEGYYDAWGNWVIARYRICRRARWYSQYGYHQVWLWGYNGWYTEWRKGYYYWYTWVNYKSYR